MSERLLYAFAHQTGIWILLIFGATLLGCYLPWFILLQQAHPSVTPLVPGTKSDEADAVQHHERNEVAMSYLMSFSSGVCLAVAFAFQVEGTSAIVQREGLSDIMRATAKASMITGITFVSFFLVEQIGSVLQDWHARHCAGVAPCAVEVASQPLEAASSLRTLSEHKGVKSKDLQCLSYKDTLTSDNGATSIACRTAPILPTLATPLIGNGTQVLSREDMSDNLNGCEYCSHEAAERRLKRRNSQGGWLVLSFLLVLFSLHSLAEGLGLGTAGRQTRTVAMAIFLHKTLSAFAVGAALLRCQVSKSLFATITIIFSAMSPLGALIGFDLSQPHSSASKPGLAPEASIYGAYCSLIAAGTFMFISLVEFLPKSFDEGIKSDYSIAARLSKLSLFLGGALAVVGTMSLAS